MPDYAQGKIYIIRAPNTNDVYIGSTCCPLNVRMAQHRSSYKRFLKNKSCYISSFEMLSNKGFYIELLEEFPCQNREQLNKREGEHIRAEENCVNKQIAGRSVTEYKQDNAETITAYAKAYRELNSEQIAVAKKAWKEANSEYVKAYDVAYTRAYRERKKAQATAQQQSQEPVISLTQEMNPSEELSQS